MSAGEVGDGGCRVVQACDGLLGHGQRVSEPDRLFSGGVEHSGGLVDVESDPADLGAGVHQLGHGFAPRRGGGRLNAGGRGQ